MDNLVGFTISLFTIPVWFMACLVRTTNTSVSGFDEIYALNGDDEADELEDQNLAMKIW